MWSQSLLHEAAVDLLAAHSFIFKRQKFVWGQISHIFRSCSCRSSLHGKDFSSTKLSQVWNIVGVYWKSLQSSLIINLQFPPGTMKMYWVTPLDGLHTTTLHTNINIHWLPLLFVSSHTPKLLSDIATPTISLTSAWPCYSGTQYKSRKSTFLCFVVWHQNLSFYACVLYTKMISRECWLS